MKITLLLGKSRRALYCCLLIGGILAIDLPAVQAQQDAQYTMYMFNGLAINPAYAGSREVLSFTGLLRAQWTGIEGSPQTQTLAIHSPIANNRMGAGLNVVNDELGVSKIFSVTGVYAYKIDFNFATLSFGMQGGITQYRQNLAGLTTNFQGILDPAFEQDINQVFPIVGAGFLLSNTRYYVGISSPQLIKNRLREVDISEAEQSRHFFLSGGYLFDLNPTMKLKPSFLVKYVENAPVSFDLNTNLWFYERFGVGASYRWNDSFDLLAEINVNKNFTFGYAYDFTISDLQQAAGSTHEVMVRLEFGVGDKTRILTPRYF
ncbi:MAG: type IX secretion system membrane protein PorP/SprF [Thermonemataceae bacterium]